MSLNFIKAWRNDKWFNKIVLIWHFTLVLIKINYGQIGDQTGFFYTTNPVFYTSRNRFVRRTGTFGNLWFFHLSRRTTVIQDLLVRHQFSLVPHNRTNVNVEAWKVNGKVAGTFWEPCNIAVNFLCPVIPSRKIRCWSQNHSAYIIAEYIFSLLPQYCRDRSLETLHFHDHHHQKSL